MKGVAALEAGRARDALAHFEEAERLFPHWATAYNIGLCQRALGHPLEAVAAFQRFLAGGEGQIPVAQFEAVAGLIKEAEAKIARLTVRASPEGASVRIDGAPASSGQPTRVNPGEHRVDATAAGWKPASRVVSVGSGAAKEIELSLERADPVQSVPRGPRLDAAFWAVAGVSVAALATGAITGAVALGDSNAYADPATPDDEAEDRRSRGEVLRVVADVSFGVAIAAGVGAALLALLREDAPPKPSGSVRPRAAAGSRGGGPRVVVRF